MYSSDYIMRTIQQFSEMLAAILFGARTSGQEVKFQDLQELSLTFTGLTLETLTALGTPQLLNLYSVTGELDINKVYASARLLHQLALGEGETQRALALEKKSLALLLKAYQALGGFLNDEHESLTAELQAKLARGN